MSKGIIIGIALFLIVILTSISSQIYLINTMVDLNKHLISAQKHIKEDDIEATKADIKKFKVGFEKSGPILKLFIRHQELEVITINSSPLYSLIDTGLKGEFMAECDKLSAQLDHIIKSDEVNLENIV
jgi:ABC-type lipoprotein release transport system permease subunit